MLATMSTRHHHTYPSHSNEMVDFNSLVWPPPDLRPPPTPVPITVHGAGNKTYTVHLGQKLSEARRLAKQEQAGSSLPIHAPIPRHPLSPAALQSQSVTSYEPEPAPLPVPPQPVESRYKSRGRFGCKDYPAGYVPTPRPVTPPMVAPPSQYQAHPAHPAPQQQQQQQPPTRHRTTYNTPVGFFEPIKAVPHPYDPEMENDDFLSPVMENGRVVSMCRISGKSGLSPGGVIERGWPSSDNGLYPTQSAAGGLTPSPLKYTHQVEPSTSHSPYSQPPPPQHHFPESPIRPTRKGYWNRRGDTLSPSGHIISASPSQAYPPDLAHYPQYQLMNEHGQTILPPGDDRVSHWRTL